MINSVVDTATTAASDIVADVILAASLLANATATATSVAAAINADAPPTVCEACGWLAAIGSMLAFGSFGVPIKSEACQRVQVDPLVFQSYKTIMCFLTSWLILFFGYEFTFTPWGIVSGLFWVPGGVATIWAVQCAGLAVAIGIGSTGIVLVSFIWGIFIFQEPVRSKAGACFAVGLMMTGLFGMAYFSTPNNSSVSPVASTPSSSSSHFSDTNADDINSQTTSDAVAGIRSKRRNRKGDYRGVAQDQDAVITAAAAGDAEEDYLDGIFSSEEPIRPPPDTIVITICNRVMKLPKRRVGICAAIFNGAWGGSIMAPMKWCKREDTSGIHFLLSFAIGASIVNLALWVIRYLYLVMNTPAASTDGIISSNNRFYQAYQLLPSFHLRELWCAGAACGLLWSIGNFFSLISVKYLGQGVGYSVIQAAMLVAGIWGICYFREVTQPAAICKWFLSAILTVSGILLLSYEHHKAR